MPLASCCALSCRPLPPTFVRFAAAAEDNGRATAASAPSGQQPTAEASVKVPAAGAAGTVPVASAPAPAPANAGSGSSTATTSGSGSSSSSEDTTAALQKKYLHASMSGARGLCCNHAQCNACELLLLHHCSCVSAGCLHAACTSAAVPVRPADPHQAHRPPLVSPRPTSPAAAVILFKEWVPTSGGAYIASCLAIIAVAVAVQALKAMSQQTEARWEAQRHAGAWVDTSGSGSPSEGGGRVGAGGMVGLERGRLPA